MKFLPPESFARARAHESMIRTAIRLRLYKLLRGSYPETLDGLHTGPHPDPFSAGSDLRYQRDGDGFSLYSVGPDGRDDGGRREGDADLVLFIVK